LSGASDFSLVFQSDSLGRFDQVVPVSKYRLGVWSDDAGQYFRYRVDGWTLAADVASPVTVEESGAQLDLRLATLELSLQLPPELANDHVTCRISRRSTGAELSTGGQIAGAGRLFRFGFIPPDDYRVRFHAGREDLWIPATFDSSRAVWVSAPAGKRVAAADTLFPAGAVRGVFASPFQPIDAERSGVILMRPVSRYFIGSGSLDGDGSFEVPLWGSGPFRVGVYCPPNQDFRWVGGDSLGNATVYEMTAGTTVDIGTIRDSAILCTIVRQPGWAPETAQMDVRLKPYGMVSHRSSSDTLLIANLGPGVYKLHLYPVGIVPWMEQWYGGTESETDAATVTISSEGELKPIEIHLAEGAKISGRILAADGTPAAQVPIWCNGDGRARTTQADDDGRYELPGLRTAGYRVAAGSTYATSTWYPDTTDPDSAAVIQVHPPEETTGIDLRLRE
jgi:hypothetical protein